MTERSWSASIRKNSRMPASISRCCPVRQTTGRILSLVISALTTGAILMASGRVPNTTTTFICGNLARSSFEPAGAADQRVDPLGRIVGRDVRPACLGNALVTCVVAAQRGNPLGQGLRLVGDEHFQFVGQLDPF